VTGDESATGGGSALYKVSLPSGWPGSGSRAAAYAFRDGALDMLTIWRGDEEYSHAFLIR